MGDAIDDIVGGACARSGIPALADRTSGMNFDADKKDVKAKVFCSVCHVGITEQRTHYPEPVMH